MEVNHDRRSHWWLWQSTLTVAVIFDRSGHSWPERSSLTGAVIFSFKVINLVILACKCTKMYKCIFITTFLLFCTKKTKKSSNISPKYNKNFFSSRKSHIFLDASPCSITSINTSFTLLFILFLVIINFYKMYILVLFAWIFFKIKEIII